MTTLIEKLQAAETGSPELNAEVFKHINPAYKRWLHKPNLDALLCLETDRCIMIREYTESIDAALTLVPEGWRVVISHRGKENNVRLVKYWLNDIQAECCEYMPVESHKSLPIAICIAALRANTNKQRGEVT